MLADCFAPVCTLVGKASVLHVEKVVRVSREENLAMIADSVAFLVGAGKRVLLDAEHFFDGFALDPGYALDCLRAAADAGAERVVLCDTNGGSLPPQIRTALAVVARSAARRRARHPHPRRLRLRGRQHAHRRRSGATQVQGTINGIGERTGNANLDHDHRRPAAEDGRAGAARRAAGAPDRDRPPARRAAQPLARTRRSPTSASTPSRTRRACTRRACSADTQTFEHIDPAVVGNGRDVLISELSGRATIVEKAREAGIAADERARPARRRARQGARARGLSVRGRRRLVRAARCASEAGERYEPLFRLESWRVIVEKRADGKVETEATIKIWVGGERYVRTAEGNGPVHALDSALREAIGEIHPHLRDIELVNFKVRILDETKGTGAVTRVLIDASDGARRVGLDRRLGEPDRRLLGRARGLARVRHAGRRAPAAPGAVRSSGGA